MCGLAEPAIALPYIFFVCLLFFFFCKCCLLNRIECSFFLSISFYFARSVDCFSLLKMLTTYVKGTALILFITCTNSASIVGLVDAIGILSVIYLDRGNMVDNVANWIQLIWTDASGGPLFASLGHFLSSRMVWHKKYILFNIRAIVIGWYAVLLMSFDYNPLASAYACTLRAVFTAEQEESNKKEVVFHKAFTDWTEPNASFSFFLHRRWGCAGLRHHKMIQWIYGNA